MYIMTKITNPKPERGVSEKTDEASNHTEDNLRK